MGDRRLAGRVPLPTQHTLDVFEQRERPNLETAIRSLTEAQEITADVPEDSVMFHQHEADPKKVWPIHKWEKSCGSMSHDDFWRSAKEKSKLSRQRCGGSELVPKAVLKPWPPFNNSSGSLSGPLARIKVDELLRNDRVLYAKRRPGFFPSTLRKRRGSIETCLMSSKRCWRQCPKIVVQNKVTSTRGREAAQQASGSLPWIGAPASRMQTLSNFQLGGREKFAIRGVRCKKRWGAWRTCGT